MSVLLSNAIVAMYMGIWLLNVVFLSMASRGRSVVEGKNINYLSCLIVIHQMLLGISTVSHSWQTLWLVRWTGHYTRGLHPRGNIHSMSVHIGGFNIAKKQANILRILGEKGV